MSLGGAADRAASAADDGVGPAAPRARERPALWRSGGATFGSQLGAAGLSLASVLITSRALGASGRGEVAFLTTIGLLTAQLATVGIHQAVANFGGRDHALSPKLATNSLALSVGLGSAGAAVVALLVAVVPAAGGSSPAWLRMIVLVSIPMLVFQAALHYLVQANYQFGASNAAWVLGPLVNATMNGLFALLGILSVETAVGTWLGGQALGTVLLVWTVRRRLGGFGRIDATLSRQMLTFGYKAHLGRVMLLGNYRMDQWILGGIAGNRQLGTYSVAVAWSEVLFFLPTALATVQRPDLVRASPQEAQATAVRILRYTMLITVPLVLGLLLMAPFLCVTVFGDDFRESVSLLRILALGAFGIMTMKLLGNCLTAQRRPLRETAGIGVAFVTILVLDVLLIPAHGGRGAAIASVLAYTAGGVAAGVIFLWTFGGGAGKLVPRLSDVRTLASSLVRLRQRRVTAVAGSASPTEEATAEAASPMDPKP